MISGITLYSAQASPGRTVADASSATGSGSHAAAHRTGEIADRVRISGAVTPLQHRKNPHSPLAEKDLSEDQKREVQRLKKRDQEVKAHEHAHMAAGGGLVQGGASFTFQRGPDGKTYAVGGEVKIDVSAERDPDQTIRKMQQVKRAALAPAQPSGTDRAVAARAAQVEAQARAEKAKEERDSITEPAAAVQGYASMNPAPPALTQGRAPLGRRIDIAA